MKTDTAAAIATGVSNSGIRIVRISGGEVFSVIDSIFRSKKGERVSSGLAQSHTVHYRYICDGDEKMDEVLAIIMRGPHSYTAEDTVEIDCHGGVLMVRWILETTLHVGARTAELGGFTKKAFSNGRPDLSRAEAVVDVVHATNEYALKSLVNQLSGSVSNKIKELRSQILYQIAFTESALDDPKHTPLDGCGSQLMDTLTSMIDEARKLLLSTDDSRLMSEGAKTAILGEPNAGKSPLMNVFLGEERAIITEAAGTIRGTLGEYIYLQGISLNVVDMVGTGSMEDVVGKIGVDRALKTARDADLIIHVVDGSRSLDENDRGIMDFIRGRKTIMLLNKSDLDLEVGTKELGQFCGHKVIPVPAKEEQGIELLEQEIKKLSYHDDLSFNNQVYIANVHHKEALKQCPESPLMVKGSVEDGMSEDLYSINLMNTYKQLGLIIGEPVDDDVTNEIFVKFCMDK